MRHQLGVTSVMVNALHQRSKRAQAAVVHTREEASQAAAVEAHTRVGNAVMLIAQADTALLRILRCGMRNVSSNESNACAAVRCGTCSAHQDGINVERARDDVASL